MSEIPMFQVRVTDDTPNFIKNRNSVVGDGASKYTEDNFFKQVTVTESKPS